MTEIVLIDVPAIESLDDVEWAWAYQGMHRVQSAAYRARFGNTDLVESAKEFQAESAYIDGELRLVTVALSGQPGEFTDGDVGDPGGGMEVEPDVLVGLGKPVPPSPDAVIGYVIASLPTDANRSNAEFIVCVDPAWESTDASDRLLRRGEEYAASEGRSTFVLYAGYGPISAGVPTLMAPVGGPVSVASGEVQLGLRSGYVISQAERQSVLHLPISSEARDPLWEKATSRNEGYRLVQWDLETPEELRESYATLRARFNSLAPTGDMDLEEQVWDAERVVQRDRLYREQGFVHVRTAAQCVKTGELAGFSGLMYAADLGPVGHQGVTIVLPDHRGHYLGLWMKLANLAEVLRRRPDLERVYTENAEENGPMLDINASMGFVPFGGYAFMRKTSVPQTPTQ